MLLKELLALTEATGDKKFDSMLDKIVQGAKSDQPVKRETVVHLIKQLEPKLGHNARYKEFDVYPEKKEVEYVTQGTTDEESQEVADQLAKFFGKAGLYGWKIKVVLRDKRRDQGTPWQTAVSKS